jgi:cytochrome c oxidase cbb3-type subunit 4
MSYEALRGFADSYGLLISGLCFLVLVAWPLRPGAKRAHDHAKTMIFQADD